MITDVTTFRSVQVKGRAVSGAQPAGPDDVALLAWYDDAFGAAVGSVGYPRALVDGLRPAAVFAVTILVDRLYDQTPGPGAGSPIIDRRDG